jgi:hypothetical protein
VPQLPPPTPHAPPCSHPLSSLPPFPRVTHCTSLLHQATPTLSLKIRNLMDGLMVLKYQIHDFSMKRLKIDDFGKKA